MVTPNSVKRSLAASLREEEMGETVVYTNLHLDGKCQGYGNDHDEKHSDLRCLRSLQQVLSHRSSEVGNPCDPETSVAAVSIIADGPISGEAQLHEGTALKDQNINADSLTAAGESQVGDADQTLRGAPYTGTCRSAMCPAVSVPKCPGERVRPGGECLDCEFIQACNSG